MPRQSRFDQSDFETMATLYAQGQSEKQIAKTFNVDGGTIHHHLERMNIARRSMSAAKRKYDLRHDAFSTVTDEATAYWLGFLFADGCINQTTTNPRINLWLKRVIKHIRSL